MSGQTFSAGQRTTGTQLTNIVYQNDDGISALAVSSGTDTTTSASYVNLAGTGSTTSFTFTKALAATRLKVTMLAGWGGTGVATVQFAVRVNSTDFDIAKAIVASAVDGFTGGVVYISGLAAGAWTVQGRWLKAGGAGNPQRTVNNWFTLTAAECT